jgi:insulysin
MSFHSSNGIEKPDLDDREYKIITLKNKLKALLISDPKTDKAAAALDVNVGAFSDYEHLPGLAHFCEHLLFMGTKKYPSENEYSSYLSNHGGHSNAYTAAEDTNYYFEVNHQYLEGAMDRFSQFFTSPLFDPSCKDREIRAVDSENKKNLQNDTWRLYQLDKSLSNPTHPYHKFSTGNLQTLGEVPESQGIDVREELLKFYKDSYSANLMKLAVIGREDLNTLEKWVVEKFTEVPNFNTAKPTFEGAVFTPNELQKLIKAKPIMTKNKLSLSFTVPDHEQNWDVQSSHYFSHLIGHEGEGSILSYLKEQGWANSLSAGGYTISQGNSTFGVDVDLTEKGLQHYEDVLYTIFQYLDIVRNEEPHQWIYEELKEISEMNFKFKQKSSPSATVSSLAKDLQKNYVPDDYILSKRVMRRFDPQLIKEFAQSLTVDKLRVTLVSQSVETDKTEKWYGTEHSVDNISSELIAKLSDPSKNTELRLPKPNEFIPTRFDVEKVEVEQPAKQPILLKNDDKFRFWYKKDDQFWVPKAYVQLFMNVPAATGSPYANTMSLLFSELVQDSLIDISYNAEIAALNFHLINGKEGFVLSFDGYNEKLPVLVKEVLNELVNFKPKRHRFEVLKEKSIRNMKNFEYKPPYNQVTTVFSTLVNDKVYTTAEKIEAMENVTFEDLEHFIPSIFKQAFVEGLIVGNYDEKEALEITEVVQKSLSFAPLFTAQKFKPRSYLLPENKIFRFEKVLPDEQNTNTCIQYFIQFGESRDSELYAKASLLAQLIKEPAFDILRTKEQLGYIVFSGILETRTTFGLRIIIQSERNAAYLESRIVNFLVLFQQTLAEMSDEAFEHHKEALIHKKLETLKNLGQENSRFTGAISSGFYDFLGHEIAVEHLKEISKKDAMQFYNMFVINGSSKLVVNLLAKAGTDREQVEGFPTGELIESAGSLQGQLYLTPAPLPVVELESFGPKL